MAAELRRGCVQPQNPYIYSENGERFHRFLGVGYFDGSIHERNLNCDYVWLPTETKEVYDLLVREDRRPIFLEGSAGSGKSAILYGIRSFMRKDGIKYYYIDGHYEKTGADHIVQIMENAEKEQAVILYDSFDYLIGKSKKIRGLPVEENQDRSRTIFAELERVIENNVPIIVTSHDETWIDNYGDLNLIPDWKGIKSRMHLHKVKGMFAGEKELSEFYQKSGLSFAESEYLANLINNPRFINYLLTLKGDKKYLDWLLEIYYKYSTAKLIVLDNLKENVPLLKYLKNDLGDELRMNRLNIWKEYIDFVFRKQYRLTFHSKL